MARAFPPVQAKDEGASAGINFGEFDGVSVEACLARVRAGDHWHNNMLLLVGHWLSRGWSDAEILSIAESVTLAGWTADQTRRDIVVMIEGGRKKWSIPDSVWSSAPLG